MAEPVRFIGANLLLKGNGENVLDMQVRKNGPVLWSCWEFSDEELLAIIRTRRAWVGMYSGDHAPFPVRLTGNRLEPFPDGRAPADEPEAARPLTEEEGKALSDEIEGLHKGGVFKPHQGYIIGEDPTRHVMRKEDHESRLNALRESRAPPPSKPFKKV